MATPSEQTLANPSESNGNLPPIAVSYRERTRILPVSRKNVLIFLAVKRIDYSIVHKDGI